MREGRDCGTACIIEWYHLCSFSFSHFVHEIFESSSLVRLWYKFTSLDPVVLPTCALASSTFLLFAYKTTFLTNQFPPATFCQRPLSLV